MLQEICNAFKELDSLLDKKKFLNSHQKVSDFLKNRPDLLVRVESLGEEKELIFYQLILIGQADFIFPQESKEDETLFRKLFDDLYAIDCFYRELGGVIGYQTKILELLEKKEEKNHLEFKFHPPFFVDIQNENDAVQEMTSWGIEALEDMAEIYPLGGAADRLHLIDEESGEDLPAAKLPFLGYSLLELLIRDLEAREYLYYQKTGRQLVVPLAIMTSSEKENHTHVLQMFEEKEFFGRPRDSIRFFMQPSVPAVKENGDWCMRGALEPVLKPGGHGALWKLAKDRGIFQWFFSQGKKKALVRQINNPLAGLDYGLLAFSGLGWKKEKVFGFASCPRLLKAAEGVNVLAERRSQVVLTNIEYCDFTKYGVEDTPMVPGSLYSRFSSNTNILFLDLKAVEEAVEKCPFPGLLINLKEGSYQSALGKKKKENIARLESTMQNIADVFVEEKKEGLELVKTFVTYNLREKTISTAKKGYISGKVVFETPENCFYDLLRANRDLLIRCGVDLPEKRTLEEYLLLGPEALFLYHPALGPTYKAIEKKISGGKIASGGELLLEISDAVLKNLTLQGSLQVIAKQPMGRYKDSLLHFSSEIGSIVLENVEINNLGIDWKRSGSFWKMNLVRNETVKIILKGKSRFIARNIKLSGNHTFVVEDGQTLEL